MSLLYKVLAIIIKLWFTKPEQIHFAYKTFNPDLHINLTILAYIIYELLYKRAT